MGRACHNGTVRAREVEIPSGDDVLAGELNVPAGAPGIVLFARGAGSSRRSARDQFVAGALRDAGLGTLLFDLLTCEERAADAPARRLRFNIDLLALRLLETTHWVKREVDLYRLRVGYYGCGTGARRRSSRRPSSAKRSARSSRAAGVLTSWGRPPCNRSSLRRC